MLNTLFLVFQIIFFISKSSAIQNNGQVEVVNVGLESNGALDIQRCGRGEANPCSSVPYALSILHQNLVSNESIDLITDSVVANEYRICAISGAKMNSTCDLTDVNFYSQNIEFANIIVSKNANDNTPMITNAGYCLLQSLQLTIPPSLSVSSLISSTGPSLTLVNCSFISSQQTAEDTYVSFDYPLIILSGETSTCGITDCWINTENTMSQRSYISNGILRLNKPFLTVNKGKASISGFRINDITFTQTSMIRAVGSTAVLNLTHITITSVNLLSSSSSTLQHTNDDESIDMGLITVESNQHLLLVDVHVDSLSLFSSSFLHIRLPLTTSSSFSSTKTYSNPPHWFDTLPVTLHSSILNTLSSSPSWRANDEDDTPITIVDSSFSNIIAGVNNGAAICAHLNGAQPMKISHTTFTSCQCTNPDSYGGAVYIEMHRPASVSHHSQSNQDAILLTITDCEFTKNSVPTDDFSGGHGGALCLKLDDTAADKESDSFAFLLSDLTFTDNSAERGSQMWLSCYNLRRTAVAARFNFAVPTEAKDANQFSGADFSEFIESPYSEDCCNFAALVLQDQSGNVPVTQIFIKGGDQNPGADNENCGTASASPCLTLDYAFASRINKLATLKLSVKSVLIDTSATLNSSLDITGLTVYSNQAPTDGNGNTLILQQLRTNNSVEEVIAMTNTGDATVSQLVIHLSPSHLYTQCIHSSYGIISISSVTFTFSSTDSAQQCSCLPISVLSGKAELLHVTVKPLHIQRPLFLFSGNCSVSVTDCTINSVDGSEIKVDQNQSLVCATEAGTITITQFFLLNSKASNHLLLFNKCLTTEISNSTLRNCSVQGAAIAFDSMGSIFLDECNISDVTMHNGSLLTFITDTDSSFSSAQDVQIKTFSTNNITRTNKINKEPALLKFIGALSSLRIEDSSFMVGRFNHSSSALHTGTAVFIDTINQLSFLNTSFFGILKEDPSDVKSSLPILHNDEDDSSMCQWLTSFVGFSHVKNAFIDSCLFSSAQEGALSLENSTVSINNTNFEDNTPIFLENSDAFPSVRHNIYCDGTSTLGISNIPGEKNTNTSLWILASNDDTGCQLKDSLCEFSSPFFIPQLVSTAYNSTNETFTIHFSGSNFFPCQFSFFSQVIDYESNETVVVNQTYSFTSFENETSAIAVLPASDFSSPSMEVTVWLQYGRNGDVFGAPFLVKERIPPRRGLSTKAIVAISISVPLTFAVVAFIIVCVCCHYCYKRRSTLSKENETVPLFADPNYSKQSSAQESSEQMDAEHQFVQENQT